MRESSFEKTYQRWRYVVENEGYHRLGVFLLAGASPPCVPGLPSSAFFVEFNHELSIKQRLTMPGAARCGFRLSLSGEEGLENASALDRDESSVRRSST